MAFWLYPFSSFRLADGNFQVGLVIGKGGETIKNMQARTGARIQVWFVYSIVY